MSRRNKGNGICHLCGMEGKLTFEHVPPQQAYNSHTVLRSGIMEMLALSDLDDRPQGKFQQGGVGAFTLCQRCNNDTGAWYSPSYIEWTRQGMYALRAAPEYSRTAYRFEIYPARVLKQIICMFMSLNNERYHQAHPDLSRYVLNKEHKDLPPQYRVYAFLTDTARSRWSGTTVQFDMNNSSNLLVCSELAFPPIGAVLVTDGPKPHPELTDISSFSKYGYDEKVERYLRLPRLPVYAPFPTDYRSKDDVVADRIRSERQLITT